MIIYSKNENLEKIAREVLSKNNILEFEVNQLRTDNYIINTSFGLRECLLLSDDGVVIDGFTSKPFSDFLYKGKTFFELLCNTTYTPNMSILATPIDKKFYIDNIELPHPFNVAVEQLKQFVEEKNANI